MSVNIIAIDNISYVPHRYILIANNFIVIGCIFHYNFIAIGQKYVLED